MTKTRSAFEVEQELEKYANPQKKAFYPKFFKTGKGEYGEGDKFLGVVTPDIRKVAKENRSLPIEEIQILLNNEYHECRLCGLLILVEQFKKATELDRKHIFDFYLANTARINNWDLVDVTCKDIVGAYLVNKPDRGILYKLAESSLLWNQRIAIISTFAFIKKHDFTDTLKLSEIYLNHQHDLMHKATGWMLREVGKHDKAVLIEFLDKNSIKMPRTMLRYSIEKFSPEERQYYLNKK